MSSDVAVIGLAVMGQNLALNLTDRGYNVAVYNRSEAKTTTFILENSTNSRLKGFSSLNDLIRDLKTPRKLLLMIKAGSPVDNFIAEVTPLLDVNDIIIDGGNSHYLDTIRRTSQLHEKSIRFLGTGISGGEEGARHGPSIMVGGDDTAWNDVKVMLQKISAKTESKEDCCNWLGHDGAGHFVKMVHNGIEYGDMQLISEAYSLMRYAFGLDVSKISNIFQYWNTRKLSSYLIEITGIILSKVDDKTGKPMVDVIQDVAEQKGTGRWTAQSGLELGVSIPLITAAVYQRSLSSDLNSRIAGSQKFTLPSSDPEEYTELQEKRLENALFVAKLISYSQGFHLLKTASNHYNWDLNLGDIALLWRAGCIIQSSFLGDIKSIYSQEPNTEHLIFSQGFSKDIETGISDLRQLIPIALKFGIPIPGLMSAIAYFDSMCSTNLSTSLIQAQRDLFGAHTFRRNDEQSGESYHHNWLD